MTRLRKIKTSQVKFIKAPTEQDYEVVACQPVPFFTFQAVPFMFACEKDYSNYLQKNESERIKAPKKDDAVVTTVLGMKTTGVEGGNTIVLRKKSI